MHAQALLNGKILPTGRMPHMEHLYNARLGHANWNILKEIDMSATEREILFIAISSIIQNSEGHSPNFNKETALCFLKKIVEDNPSCMRNIAHGTYVTQQGESYDGIKGLWGEISSKAVKDKVSGKMLTRSEHMRKIGSKGGKASAEATQDTPNEDGILKISTFPWELPIFLFPPFLWVELPISSFPNPKSKQIGMPTIYRFLYLCRFSSIFVGL